MKTVLITGINGFVGGHLVKELTDNGIDVIGVGGHTGTSEALSHLKDYMVLDLMDADAACKIDLRDVDGIIHLAALSASGPSFDRPLEYIHTNIGLETNLFEAALAQDVRPRFLVVSSGLLYDPAASLPLDEHAHVAPTSPYAVSKIGQEQMAHYYGSRGFEYVIARPFNHIGPGQNPGFIVPDLAQQIVACKRGQSAEVRVGNLDAKRDYTDVRDIVRAYRMMLESGVSGEAYNICSGQARSGHEVLDGLLKAAEIQPKVAEDPEKMRPSDNPLIYGNHAKLTAATGWHPEIAFEATLADVVNDWQNRS